jgi:excinuclease ABC subunit C
MLPFSMFRLCPSLPRPTHSPSCALPTPQSDSSSFFNIPTFKPSNPQTTPSVTPLRAILDAASSISPVFATLTKNTRGGGYPSSSANSVNGACSGPVGALSSLPSPSFRNLQTFQLSNLPTFPRAIPLIIRSSAKRVRNSCRMRSFKTRDLNSFRMRSYKKTGEGESPLFKRICLSVPTLLAVSCLPRASKGQLSASRFPLYPVTVLELDCGLEFDPARDEDFFATLPPKPAVCLIESRAENAEPFLIRTQDLRRRLQRLLGPADPTSKRLNLRELAGGIRYRLTGSALEQIFTYYQHAKHLFPQRARKLTRLRPPAVLKISLRNAYPRCYVTRRIAVDESGAPTAGAYYGPFPSRKSALAFSEQALDLFKVRRCQIKIRRDPTFPGCIYSEMKMCLAPCFAGCTKEEYDAEVQRLVQFLDTNGNSLRAAIEDDRERASADLDFERAAQLHKRIEKLDDALRFRPELARRIADLDAVILQRAAEEQSIGVFGIHGGRLAEPFFLRFAEIASQPRSAEHIFKDYLEGNAAAPQGGEKPGAAISTNAAVQSGENSAVRPAALAREELSEHLALISRWFYSNPRDGEIFFREKDWPYRKILRACSRLLSPKSPEPPASEKKTPETPTQGVS